MLCSLLNVIKGYFIVSGLFGNYYVGPNNKTVAVSTVYENNRVTICNDLQYMKCFTGVETSNKFKFSDNIYKFKNLKDNQIHYVIYDNHSKISQKHISTIKKMIIDSSSTPKRISIVSPKKNHVSPKKNHVSPKKNHVLPKTTHVSPKKNHVSPKTTHVSPKTSQRVKQVSRATLASKDEPTKAENSHVKPSPRKSVSTTKSPESPISTKAPVSLTESPISTKEPVSLTESPISTKAPVHSETHEHDDHEHDDHEHEHDEHEQDDHEHDEHEHDEHEQREKRYRRHLHHIIRKIIRHKMLRHDEDDD